ncbi:MAG TPA: LysR substrate-binding domain-containing protein, partial [Sphingomicrobium sp.]|nr:LysR substrate-binding domain-containing protein [Sphingomicrobium sp.]
GLLAPILRELHDRHPEIVIELDTSQKVVDLGSGAADIALRSSSSEQPAGLVGRRLCIDDWTLYCSRDYASRNGAPTSLEELRHHPIVGGGGGNLWRHYEAWLKSLGLEEQVAMHHATSTGLLSAVRSGFGIAVLPCVVADGDPELLRCLDPRTEHGRVLWLLTHERVRHAPRVRAVIDFLYERLSRHVRELEAKQVAA